MIKEEFIDGHSIIHRLDPRVKILAALFFSIVVAVSSSRGLLVLSFLFCFFILVLARLNLKGLSGFEDRVTYRLSGGEKKLVSLATVLSMQPEILLLDEPIAGLDEPTTERIMEFLKTSGLSYVIVSHDHDFILKTAQVLYQIKDGFIKRLESHMESEEQGESVHDSVSEMGKMKPMESFIRPQISFFPEGYNNKIFL